MLSVASTPYERGRRISHRKIAGGGLRKTRKIGGVIEMVHRDLRNIDSAV